MMPLKIFEFHENGLSYTVTLTQEDGGPVMATVTVLSGSMDVNAIYYADDNHSGPSTNLGGPLNMNGAGSEFEGETVQWDGAQALSRPGLGREGTSKETFLSADSGNSELGPFFLTSTQNLEDIDFVGIRATSTSTPEGSIKGVATGEEPEEPVDPVCELPDGTNKVFFAMPTNDHPENGLYIRESDLTLEPGQEATLQDYYDTFVAQMTDFDADYEDYLSEIVAYEVSFDADGRETITELGRYPIGEQVNSDSPLPVICVDEDDDTMTDDDTDTAEQLVA